MDDGRLGQVIVNLLVNAAQAIPKSYTRDHKITIVTRKALSRRYAERRRPVRVGSGIGGRMFGDFLSDFITIWVIVDPITALPIFIGLTGAFDKPTQRKIAAMATFVALLVLVFFIAVGQIIINAMGISLRAFGSPAG
jgi:hypothetical protein